MDFEGALWRRDLSGEGMMKLAKGEYELPEGAVDVMKNLTEDRKNEVWLLSGL